MDKVIPICLITCALYGCTISFQNIDTHGIARDVVDENQNTSPNISPVVTIPFKPTP